MKEDIVISTSSSRRSVRVAGKDVKRFTRQVVKKTVVGKRDGKPVYHSQTLHIPMNHVESIVHGKTKRV